MKKLEIIKGNEITEICFSGSPLLRELLEKSGFPVDSPCGGKGKCGKCAIEVSGDISAPTEEEIKRKIRLSCKTKLLGDAKVVLPENYGKAISVEITTEEIKASADFNYGAVLDIGTTTLALKLFSGDGRAVARSTGVNPQRSVSSDVIGRIEASRGGKAEKLKNQISDAISDLIADACKQAEIKEDQIGKTVVVGNTAMLYLLCGLDPKSLANAPFEADNLFDIIINDPINDYLPPCITAFVGADLVAAVLASGMCDKKETALLCDIGTNGEIALWKAGKLYVTSAAAGPAFEGAEISCGCPCADGAIESVTVEDGKVKARTVNGSPAVGICGSGLVDAVAVFLELGYIDENGASPSQLNLPSKGEPVYITKEDVRALQLAKSAVRSAMELLLEVTETSLDEVAKLYLSGGFGNSLNLRSAVIVGLIPRELSEKAVLMGNGALSGGAMLLFDDINIEKTKAFVRNSCHVELGGNPRFNELFVKKLNF